MLSWGFYRSTQPFGITGWFLFEVSAIMVGMKIMLSGGGHIWPVCLDSGESAAGSWSRCSGPRRLNGVGPRRLVRSVRRAGMRSRLLRPPLTWGRSISTQSSRWLRRRGLLFVPGPASALAQQLRRVLDPLTEPRQLELLLDLWARLVEHHARLAGRGRLLATQRRRPIRKEEAARDAERRWHGKAAHRGLRRQFERLIGPSLIRITCSR